MDRYYKAKVNNKEILIDDSNGFTAVVIVEYLDFFDTFDTKFVRITGMRKYFKHKQEFVIVIESDYSAKLVEKELRVIDFQNKIIGNDLYALEQISKGIQLIDKPYYDEPYYEQ